MNLYKYLLGAAFFICVVAVGGVLLMVGLMAVSSMRKSPVLKNLEASYRQQATKMRVCPLR